MAIKKESDRDGFPLQNLHQPDHSPKIRSTKPYPEVAIKKESNRDDFYSQSQYQPDRPPKITKPYQQVRLIEMMLLGKVKSYLSPGKLCTLWLS